MAEVRIVTDSACDLSDDQIARYGIEVVPLTIRFGDEEFVDRRELSVQDFYRRMATSAVLPETAAPSPGAFEAAFRKAADEGADGVVCVSLSSKLSATMQAAQNAAKALDGVIPVEVVDSESVTLGLGNQVIAAAEAARDGRSAADIAELVRDVAARTRVYGTLDTLDNLKKGGRIGGAQALVGTLLSIKPIVSINGGNGAVEEASKQRTRKRAFQWLRDTVFAEPSVEHLSVLHGEAPDVEDLIDLLSARYAREDLNIGLIGPVIGTHGGPRVVGVTFQIPR